MCTEEMEVCHNIHLLLIMIVVIIIIIIFFKRELLTGGNSNFEFSPACAVIGQESRQVMTPSCLLQKEKYQQFYNKECSRTKTIESVLAFVRRMN